MTVFIVVATAMLLIAVALILWPLLRPNAARAVEHTAANVSIFRDQFADLDADLARGTISGDQYAESKSELERRLLDETRAASEPTLASVSHRWAAIAVALMTPIAAAALYWQVGTPAALDEQVVSAKSNPITREQIDAMIVQLRQKLEKDPASAEGWAILARTHYTLGNFSEAVAAYEKLVALQANDADVLADYADALAMSRGRRVTGEPMALVQRALQINSKQWKALAMAGSEAFDRKDYKTALDYWQRLQDSAPADSPVAKQIQGSIDEARRLAGLPPVATAKGDASKSANGDSVSGTVALSPSLASQVKPDDAVFIFARPADGSRMPVAIVRARAAELPLQFTLDDSRSMAGTKISSLPEVIIAARISRSGKATPSSGDLEGAAGKVKVGATGVSISIDRVVP